MFACWPSDCPTLGLDWRDQERNTSLASTARQVLSFSTNKLKNVLSKIVLGKYEKYNRSDGIYVLKFYDIYVFSLYLKGYKTRNISN